MNGRNPPQNHSIETKAPESDIIHPSSWLSTILGTFRNPGPPQERPTGTMLLPARHNLKTWSSLEKLCVLLRVFYCCNKTPGPQTTWGVKGVLQLTAPGLRNLGQDLSSREEYWLLASSPLVVQPALVKDPGPTAHEWHGPEWPGPSHINHQSGKYTSGLSKANLLRSFFSTEITYFQKWPQLC